jgi:exodeoxyribonuclease V alpha subunit
VSGANGSAGGPERVGSDPAGLGHETAAGPEDVGSDAAALGHETANGMPDVGSTSASGSETAAGPEVIESGSAGSETAEGPEVIGSGSAPGSEASPGADPAADPWRALDDPDATPAGVDTLAQEHLGHFVVDDVRRSAGLTSWLVRRAAADGSTTLDGVTWAAALRGYGIDSPRPGLDAAATAGRVVGLPSERALAHPRWGPLEEQLADDVHAIVASGGPDTTPADPADAALAMPLCAVIAGRGCGADDWARRLRKLADAAGRPVTIVDDAHRFDLAAAAEIIENHDADASLVLVGDPDQLEPAEPGRFFGDLVTSGVVPTVRLPVDVGPAGGGAREAPARDGGEATPDDAGAGEAADAPGVGEATGAPGVGKATGAEDAPIVRLIESLRAGDLPRIEPRQHAVVVSPVADAAEAVARVRELVTEALPRVLGVGPSDVVVLGIRSAGAAGVGALREALGGNVADAAGGAIEVAAVHEAVGRRAEAVVLVLPAESAGSLTRAHLISAASMASRHLSIVHQAGPALADAVRLRPHRPRHTRLARLLRT